MALVPVFQASKVISGTWSGTDFDYPVGADAARDSVNDGYSIDGVAFVAEDTALPGYNAFTRYVRNNFHFFTTNTQGENLTGWTLAPADKTAYMLPVSSAQPSGAVALQRWWSGSSQTGVAHFFAADTAVTPVPSVFVAEDPTHVHTGWCLKPARVEFQVTYNGNGQASGISVTGGNAVNTVVSLPDGSSYTLEADDALVAYGVGNWLRFNKADPASARWHFYGLQVTPTNGTPPNHAVFSTILSADEWRLAVVDEDDDNSHGDYAYKYTLQIYDEVTDRVVDFDPKIINRAPAVTN